MAQENGENITPIKVRIEANSLLNQMPFLKTDSNAPSDPDRARRAVVRGVMKPFAYFLLENAGASPDARNALGKMQTPEEIVFAIATHPSIGLEAEKQQELLSEFGPGENRDWKTIGLAITMQDKHPLSQLSLLIKDKLSSNAKKELTMDELSSY